MVSIPGGVPNIGHSFAMKEVTKVHAAMKKVEVAAPILGHLMQVDMESILDYSDDQANIAEVVKDYAENGLPRTVKVAMRAAELLIEEAGLVFLFPDKGE